MTSKNAKPATGAGFGKIDQVLAGKVVFRNSSNPASPQGSQSRFSVFWTRLHLLLHAISAGVPK
jgi:hypothetical protein